MNFIKTAALHIFLIVALACVIAQEFAIHLLSDRCQSIITEYNRLVMREAEAQLAPPAEIIPWRIESAPNLVQAVYRYEGGLSVPSIKLIGK